MRKGGEGKRDKEGHVDLQMDPRQVTVGDRGSFTVYTCSSQGGDEQGPHRAVLCLHGASHCACSWALFARLLRDLSKGCDVYCYDARG